MKRCKEIQQHLHIPHTNISKADEITLLQDLAEILGIWQPIMILHSPIYFQIQFQNFYETKRLIHCY